MRDTSRIVINTGPTIALVGAVGSLDILENLIRAKRAGQIDSVREAIRAMYEQGIHLSERVMKKALEEAGEAPDGLSIS